MYFIIKFENVKTPMGMSNTESKKKEEENKTIIYKVKEDNINKMIAYLKKKQNGK
jgi:hypothetical protein